VNFKIWLALVVLVFAVSLVQAQEAPKATPTFNPESTQEADDNPVVALEVNQAVVWNNQQTLHVAMPTTEVVAVYSMALVGAGYINGPDEHSARSATGVAIRSLPEPTTEEFTINTAGDNEVVILSFALVYDDNMMLAVPPQFPDYIVETIGESASAEQICAGISRAYAFFVDNEEVFATSPLEMAQDLIDSANCKRDGIAKIYTGTLVAGEKTTEFGDDFSEPAHYQTAVLVSTPHRFWRDGESRINNTSSYSNLGWPQEFERFYIQAAADNAGDMTYLVIVTNGSSLPSEQTIEKLVDEAAAIWQVETHCVMLNDRTFVMSQVQLSLSQMLVLDAIQGRVCARG
jgi:hypothetical protein